ncbi:hypothetical protein ABD91_20440 [Lysinibacillus sphaericus]|uniref:hypothetical protein n=1 Tax=Lysinibacillus sphaericus TaxID=1421 RepID=UPI0018CE8178|nr:hypothetical protein [Lysinibacillus sphaericus]MBG9693117.1 hypothetical protein [Lysinibacillus sphaericus]
MKVRKTSLEDDNEVFGSPNMEIIEKPLKEEPVKEPMDLEEVVDATPVGSFNTYIIMLIMTIILGVTAIVQLHISTILYAIFFGIFITLLNKESRKFDVTKDDVVYIQNVAHTLKTFFIRVLGFKRFFVNRKKNIMIAAAVLLIEQVTIRGVLPYSFSTTIHYAALTVLFISTLFIISTKEFRDLKQVGNVVVVLGSIAVVFTQLFYKYVAIDLLFVMVMFLVLGNFAMLHGDKFNGKNK